MIDFAPVIFHCCSPPVSPSKFLLSKIFLPMIFDDPLPILYLFLGSPYNRNGMACNLRRSFNHVCITFLQNDYLEYKKGRIGLNHGNITNIPN